MYLQISWTAHPKHKAADSLLVGRRKIENKSKTEGDIVVDDNNKSETITSHLWWPRNGKQTDRSDIL